MNSSLYTTDDILTNTNVIKIYYHNDYLVYKKNNVINIFNSIKIIYKLFDEEFNKNLIKIFILKKKNKLSENDFLPLRQIYDLIYLLNELKYVDQYEIMEIFILLYKIYMSVPYLESFFENYILRELINYKYITENIKNISYQLSNDNILMNFLFKIKTIHQMNDDEIKLLLADFVRKISFDFFMYYSAEHFYYKMINSVLQILNIVNNDNLTIEIINFVDIFKNYKTTIIKEYEHYHKKYTEIYFVKETDLKVKFKFVGCDILEKIINELKIIKSLN